MEHEATAARSNSNHRTVGLAKLHKTDGYSGRAVRNSRIRQTISTALVGNCCFCSHFLFAGVLYARVW